MIAFLDGRTADWWEDRANKWTGGRSLEEAIDCAKWFNRNGKRVLLNILGEKCQTKEQADWFTEQYLQAIGGIRQEDLNAGISCKLTSLGLCLDKEYAKQNLWKILKQAEEQGVKVEIDIENRDTVESAVEIVADSLKSGYTIDKFAMQSGLKNCLELAKGLLAQGKLGFRIVTGSCYRNNGNGYRTTLETDEKTTDKQFYDLINLCGKGSAVGTKNRRRAVYAIEKGLEVQSLKGEENDYCFVGGKDNEVGSIADTFYVCFGDWRTNKGARAYILRREA